MPFIELHISHASEADPQPILVNTANICFLYTMLGSTESGTIIRSGKNETFFATETYEEIKSLILQAEKA